MTVTLGHVENPSAKIQWIQIPMTAPGQCATCGSGQDKNGFVDTGLDAEFWGRIIFCYTCTREIGAVFGFIAPEDYEELDGERNLALLNLDQAENRNREFEGIVRGLNNLGGFFNRAGLPSSPIVETPEPEQPPSSGTEQTELEPVQSSSGNSSESSQQSGKVAGLTGGKGLLNI